MPLDRIAFLGIFISLIATGCSESEFAGVSAAQKKADETPTDTPVGETIPGQPVDIGTFGEGEDVDSNEVFAGIEGLQIGTEREDDLIIEVGGTSLGKPCEADGYLKPVASTVTNTYQASMANIHAYDCSLKTMWNAGNENVNHIMIDLGEAKALDKVLFSLAYSANHDDSAKFTSYQIYAGVDSGSLSMVKEFTMSATKNASRFFWGVKSSHENFRYIKIITTQTSSWVAWLEIEAYERP